MKQWIHASFGLEQMYRRYQAVNRKEACGKLFLALALAALVPALTAKAQNTNSGELRGTVTDTTGAVIPGAMVQVKDVDKGVVRAYVTNGSGLYDTGSITPDHYLLTFTKTGFGTFVRGPISLDVSIQTIDAQLMAGSTQEVVVTTDVPLLDTDTGAQEATLSSEVMSQLPQDQSGCRLGNLHCAAARRRRCS